MPFRCLRSRAGFFSSWRLSIYLVVYLADRRLQAQRWHSEMSAGLGAGYLKGISNAVVLAVADTYLW